MDIRVPTRGNRRLEALLEAANADERVQAWWHMQQVMAERLLRLLERRGVEPTMVAQHGMRAHDAEVVIAAACLLHDTGMSIHRTDHEEFSLFLAADRLPLLLEGIYAEPELTVVTAEALHAIIGHRRRGDPMTIEAGIVRVADALDMAGEERTVRIEIAMNNSSGLFQVDELLATKLRGSGLEEHLEVVARIDAEHEKRLVPVFRI